MKLFAPLSDADEVTFGATTQSGGLLMDEWIIALYCPSAHAIDYNQLVLFRAHLQARLCIRWVSAHLAPRRRHNIRLNRIAQVSHAANCKLVNCSFCASSFPSPIRLVASRWIGKVSNLFLFAQSSLPLFNLLIQLQLNGHWHFFSAVLPRCEKGANYWHANR